MAEAEEPDLRTRLRNALDSDVPVYYINGFVNTLSAADITTVLETNGKPVAVINMSFTLAKTISIALGGVIAHLEERTGRTMLTTHELAKALEGSDTQ